MFRIHKIKTIILFLILTIVSTDIYGRKVDVIINKDEQNISIIDIDYVYEDTTRYDYVFPEELKLYTIYKADTQCIFVAPCASEYTIKSKNCCEIYLWPSRIIYPDDCICLIEDSGEGCFKNIADAELCMHIEFIDNNSVFTIIPLIDILERTKEYSQFLFGEMEGQKSEGTFESAFFWSNVYETIIHNNLMFYLFTNTGLQSKDLLLLSSKLMVYKYW